MGPVPKNSALTSTRALIVLSTLIFQIGGFPKECEWNECSDGECYQITRSLILGHDKDNYTDCPKGFDKYEAHCFRLTSTPKSWYNASLAPDTGQLAVLLTDQDAQRASGYLQLKIPSDQSMVWTSAIVDSTTSQLKWVPEESLVTWHGRNRVGLVSSHDANSCLALQPPTYADWGLMDCTSAFRSLRTAAMAPKTTAPHDFMCRCGKGHVGERCDKDAQSSSTHEVTNPDAIQCQDNTLISVEFALHETASCNAPNALALLRYFCQGKNTCNLDPTVLRPYLGHACGNAPLTIRYSCVPQNDMTCPSEMMEMVNKRAIDCILITDPNTTWHEAMNFCLVSGGQLAALNGEFGILNISTDTGTSRSLTSFWIFDHQPDTRDDARPDSRKPVECTMATVDRQTKDPKLKIAIDCSRNLPGICAFPAYLRRDIASSQTWGLKLRDDTTVTGTTKPTTAVTGTPTTKPATVTGTPTTKSTTVTETPTTKPTTVRGTPTTKPTTVTGTPTTKPTTATGTPTTKPTTVTGTPTTKPTTVTGTPTTKTTTATGTPTTKPTTATGTPTMKPTTATGTPTTKPTTATGTPTTKTTTATGTPTTKTTTATGTPTTKPTTVTGTPTTKPTTVTGTPTTKPTTVTGTPTTKPTTVTGTPTTKPTTVTGTPTTKPTTVTGTPTTKTTTVTGTPTTKPTTVTGTPTTKPTTVTGTPTTKTTTATGTPTTKPTTVTGTPTTKPTTVTGTPTTKPTTVTGTRTTKSTTVTGTPTTKPTTVTGTPTTKPTTVTGTPTTKPTTVTGTPTTKTTTATGTPSTKPTTVTGTPTTKPTTVTGTPTTKSTTVTGTPTTKPTTVTGTPTTKPTTVTGTPTTKTTTVTGTPTTKPTTVTGTPTTKTTTATGTPTTKPTTVTGTPTTKPTTVTGTPTTKPTTVTGTPTTKPTTVTGTPTTKPTTVTGTPTTKPTTVTGTPTTKPTTVTGTPTTKSTTVTGTHTTKPSTVTGTPTTETTTATGTPTTKPTTKPTTETGTPTTKPTTVTGTPTTTPTTVTGTPTTKTTTVTGTPTTKPTTETGTPTTMRTTATTDTTTESSTDVTAETTTDATTETTTDATTETTRDSTTETTTDATAETTTDATAETTTDTTAETTTDVTAESTTETTTDTTAETATDTTIMETTTDATMETTTETTTDATTTATTDRTTDSTTTTHSTSTYVTTTLEPPKNCSEQDYGGIKWPPTISGADVTQPCPYGQTGSATWTCQNSGQFDPQGPNMRNCTTTVSNEINDLSHNLTSGANPDAVITDLAESLNEADTIAAGDIANALDLVDTAIIFQKDKLKDLSEAEQIQSMQTFTIGIVNTSGILLSPEHLESWFGLNEIDRASVATKLLVDVDVTGFLYASILDTTQSPMYFVYSQILDLLVDVTHGNSELNLPNVIIPSEAFEAAHESPAGNFPIISTTYNTIGAVMPTGDRFSNYTDVSQVVGASLNQTIQLTSTNVTVTFEKPADASAVLKESLCVFWDEDDSVWSDEGCYLSDDTNDTHFACNCNHMTSFAVLMSLHPEEVNTVALNIITIVGCLISIVCLALCIASFSLVRSQRNNWYLVHLHLCISLMIADIILIVAHFYKKHHTEVDAYCTVLAMLLHYFYLATFMWMLLEGVQIYLALVRVFAARKQRHYLYFLAGYGVPAVIVAASAGVNVDGYASTTDCFLDTESGFIWGFIAFVALTIIVNTVLLILSLRSAARMKNTLSMKQANTAKTWLWQLTILHPLLGLTWVFGFLQFGDQLVFSYLFTILNSLQGLFIFLFHVFRNDNVRKYVAKKFHCRGAAGEGSSQSQPMSSTDQTGDRSRQSSTDTQNSLSFWKKDIKILDIRKGQRAANSNGVIVLDGTEGVYRRDEQC